MTTWDNQLLLSDAQSLTSLVVGTTDDLLSTNYFDTLTNDVFRSPGMGITFRVTTGFTTSTAPTLTITAFYDAVYSTTAVTRAVVGRFQFTSSEAVARLTAGAEFFLPIAPVSEVEGLTAAAANRLVGLGNAPKGRIFALQYSVSGSAAATFTAGALTAGVTPAPVINTMGLGGVHPTFPATAPAGLGAPNWAGTITP